MEYAPAPVSIKERDMVMIDQQSIVPKGEMAGYFFLTDIKPKIIRMDKSAPIWV